MLPSPSILLLRAVVVGITLLGVVNLATLPAHPQCQSRETTVGYVAHGVRSELALAIITSFCFHWLSVFGGDGNGRQWVIPSIS